MANPQTPKSGHDFSLIIKNLNANFNLNLPEPAISTPSRERQTLAEKCVGLAKFLYYSDPLIIQRVIESFSERARTLFSEPASAANQQSGNVPASRSFIRSNTISMARNITLGEQEKALQYLWELLSDEEYIVTQGSSRIHRDASTTTPTGTRPTAGRSFGLPAASTGGPTAGSGMKTSAPPESPTATPSKMPPSPSKRKGVIDDSEVFVTAPNTPSNPFYANSSPLSDDEFENSDLDDLDIDLNAVSRDLADSSDNDQRQRKAAKTGLKQRRLDDYMKISKSVQKPRPSHPGKPVNSDNSSFETVTTEQTNSFRASFGASTAPTSPSRSFEIEQPDLDQTSQYSSTVRPSPSEEFEILSDSEHTTGPSKNERSEEQQEPELDEGREQKIRKIIRELEENGPFSNQNVIKTTVPLRYRYEAQRAANSLNLPVESILQKLDRRKLPDYDDFWKNIHNGRRPRLERTAPEPWEMAVDQYENKKPTGDVVTLSCELSWCSPKEPGYFKLALNPMKFMRSYRFCRRFGSDRFLEMTYPTLTEPPAHLVRKEDGVDKDILLEAIARWMATSEHHLVGRVWRGLYLEDIQNKQPKRASKRDAGDFGVGMGAMENPHKQRAVFFATDGIDFRKAGGPQDIPPQAETSGQRTAMSIDTLIDWHMPRAHNSHQSDMKLFQRLHLGLSRTLSTVVLRREEIVYLEDPPGRVMNDGCALMSRSLGMQIAHILGIDGIPACFQARISGAKGVWMVDRDDSRFKAGDRGFGLQITQSQLKIHPAPPHDTSPADDMKLAFEVVQWSRPLKPASLNLQLLNILQHGGIRNDHIKNLIRQEMSSFYDDFLETLLASSGPACRSWLQKTNRVSDESYKRQTKHTNNFFPAQYAEQAVLLLDAGFLPLKLPYLTKIFRRLLQDYLDNLKNLKVTVSQTTFAYCIADPFGVLAPEEVHLGFSHEWGHGDVGTELHDIDVLVARLPAHLATDIQKRRSVYKNELRHFKDVIVFPTTGDTPLASILSGGDYDGDQCWVCWDPIIVREFNNTEFDHAAIPTSKDLGLRPCSTQMTEVGSTEGFLAKAFKFNAKPSKLGQCTIEHETFCYHENNIASPRAVRLAWLLSYLVDSKKSGIELTEDAWEELQPKYTKIFTEKDPFLPAYKSLSRGSRPPVWNSFNIIDYLLFDVIVAESENMIIRFDKFCEEHSELPIDPHLVDIWNKVEKQANEEKQQNKPELYNALHDVRKQFREKKAEWDELTSPATRTPYARKIVEAAQKLQEIQPPDFDHPLGYTWRNSSYEWEQLRASCAYKDCRSDFVWYAAGPTLCEMKAKALRSYRPVTHEIHGVLHVNRNAAKRAMDPILGHITDEANDPEDEDEDISDNQ
ncbi:hypothetical protein AJ78_05371 [Emergomyces pasteurianus Ep9510]|uniref:RNA-dependent RNA polymerase n=1 Tax=Emergomyces pasteurianus Ep9510 TaxID=1447872 RepID=A0A1J9QGG1_9EURO|nr:hypothetical protein AJ78_05371 [Emergomyces pasteurianus Ep9510]